METFYNRAICDIYIGKGAGKKLLDDILTAKKNVKIISPYLSPFLIKELIYLHTNGTKIQLITTDSIEDFYGSYDKNIYKLINQHQIKDLEAEKIRNKWIHFKKYISYSIVGLGVVLITFVCLFRENKLFYGIIPIAFLILIRTFLQKKIRTKKIYTYKYSQLFPFKVFVTPQNSNTYNKTFIHGKIYIIDDEIVYMGSLNFTGSGTKDNYETRIRTTDRNPVIKIVEEFDELFYHSGLHERDIQFWGKQLYKEPIN